MAPWVGLELGGTATFDEIAVKCKELGYGHLISPPVTVRASVMHHLHQWERRNPPVVTADYAKHIEFNKECRGFDGGNRLELATRFVETFTVEVRKRIKDRDSDLCWTDAILESLEESRPADCDYAPTMRQNPDGESFLWR